MTDIVRSRWPWPSEQGPLPALLIALTLLTGLVDGVSYLALGHVFVANMTGNVVFLGFGLAGAEGVSAVSSLVALGSFVLGSVAGGRIAARCREHRGRHLRTATATAVPLLLVALTIATVAGQPVPRGARYATIVSLALAMGIQNATARRLAVPDLTTTVLTLTLTGIGADSPLAGGQGAHVVRRLIAVATMLVGALISAMLVIHVDVVIPLAVAAGVAALTAGVAHRLSGDNSDWARPPERS